MINTGTCPKCGNLIMNIEIEDMPIHLNFQPAWKGISYLCPSCRAILAVGIDPVALKTDLRNEILNVLQGKKL